MSGYKNMWFGTRKQHLAFVAFAGYHGYDEDNVPSTLLDEWDELGDEQQARWYKASENVDGQPYTD